MFNFDPVILKQSTSEINVGWKEVENCDVYKIEHNTVGLEGKVVYWGKDPKCQISHLHDNFCYKFKIYAMKLLDGEYKVLSVSDIFKASTLPNIPTTISFYRAVRKAQDYLVRRYIAHGSHLIDVPGPNLLTPLANAVLIGNKDIVEIIINAKADINSGCPLIRRTPLHLGETIQWNVFDYNLLVYDLKLYLRFFENISMLHGHVTIGKLLIDRKADKSLKDTIGLNLVHYAMNGGHFNAIRFALDNAEDDALIEQNQFGGNILIYAIFMRCHVKIIKLLIGYDHRIKTSSEQKTEALHLADITNQCETLVYLQKSFANFVVKD